MVLLTRYFRLVDQRLVFVHQFGGKYRPFYLIIDNAGVVHGVPKLLVTRTFTWEDNFKDAQAHLSAVVQQGEGIFRHAVEALLDRDGGVTRLRK